MIKPAKFWHFLRSGEVLLMTGFPLAGTLFAFQTVDASMLLKTALFFTAMLLLFTSIYSFNSYCGYEKDLRNLRLSSIRESSRKSFLATSFIFLAVSLAIYLYLNTVLLAMAIASFVMWLFYSLPRIGLKNFPLTGTLVHFLSQVLHFQMGYVLLAPLSERSLLVSGYFALLFAGGHLLHELIDYDADARAGIVTGAVYFGRRKARGLYYVTFGTSGIYLIALLLSGCMRPWEAGPFLAALAAQLISPPFIRKATANDREFFLLVRRCNRAFYLAGGAGFIIFKLILGMG